MKYGVFGQPVEVACSLEEMNKEYASSILVCSETHSALNSNAVIVGVDIIQHDRAQHATMHEPKKGHDNGCDARSVFEVRLKPEPNPSSDTA